jgi:O-antigen ligase
MKRWWLYWFPLLFLPNMGITLQTQFGVLELSDILIVPYVGMVYFAADFKRRSLIDRVVSLLVVFLIWAVLTTISLSLRYRDDDFYFTEVGLYKLARLLLYGIAGYWTVKAVRDDRTRRGLAWSILAAGLFMGLGLALWGQKTGTEGHVNADGTLQGYKASNAVSVYAAMLACYLAALWSRRKSMSPWARRLTVATLVLLVLGSGISEGRGGWVAGFLGLVFLALRGGFRRQTMAIVFATPVVLWGIYATVPVFRNRVNATFRPTAAGVETTVGVDDGGRPDQWLYGVGQFMAAPVLGTGFFHRGADTGTDSSGSHNFFLQMFIETGLPGGILIIAILRGMWKTAGSNEAIWRGVELPVKASLVAAVAGGMSGEYFYGSSGLLLLFALYAPCGSLAISGGRARTRHTAGSDPAPNVVLAVGAPR